DILREKLLNINLLIAKIEALNDLHPYFDDNPLSGSTTYSANSLLEEFIDELALITYPSDYDDNLQFVIKSDLKEIEFLLYQGLMLCPQPTTRTRIFDPPFYEPLFFKDVPKSKMLLPFSSKNEEKVFKPGIYTFKKASPPDSELVSSKVMEIVIPEVGKIDDDILLTIKDDILREKLLNINLLIAKIEALNNLHPYFDDNPLSGSTTYSANSLLEEFIDELALITYPSDYDDNLQFVIEFDLKEIEFLLYQGKGSSLKDLIDLTDLANLDDNFVDPIPEMFTNEHAPDYSSPSRFDVYEDDFLEVESVAENVYNDPFDSKGEKIKESKLLIDELDQFIPSFNSILRASTSLGNDLASKGTVNGSPTDVGRNCQENSGDDRLGNFGYNGKRWYADMRVEEMFHTGLLWSYYLPTASMSEPERCMEREVKWVNQATSTASSMRDYGVMDDDYKGPPVFDDDQYEEKLMPVYDTAIEDVIEEEENFFRKGGFDGEEDNIENVIVVANC
nr:hypothetical protein [Tanacetum cinerariifolium]